MKRSVVLCLSLVAWLCLFVLGFHIDTDPFRAILRAVNPDDLSFNKAAIAFVIAVTAWTWTNCLLLSCAASLLGEVGGVFREGRESVRKSDFSAALSRGFFLYLLVMSGQLVIGGGFTEGDTASTDAAHYFRIAGVVSLFGFVVGFSPDFFASVLDRASSALAQRGRSRGGHKTTEAGGMNSGADSEHPDEVATTEGPTTKKPSGEE